MKKWTLKLLDRSLEVPLRIGPKRRLDRELARSADLRTFRDERTVLRRAVADSGFRGFAPGFAGRVLSRLAERSALISPLEIADRAYRLVFNRLVLAAGVMTVILLLVNLAKGELVPRVEILYASDLTIAGILKAALF